MTRKMFIIKGIAIYFIGVGIWYICNTISLTPDGQKPNLQLLGSINLQLNLVDTIIGIFMFGAGKSLFGLNEAGRQAVITLMMIYLVWNSILGIIFIGVVVLQPSVLFNFYGTGPLASLAGFVVMFFMGMPLLFALLVVIFLRQKETQELFLAKAPEQIERSDVAVEQPGN